MKVKNILYEDFVNYRECSMFIGMPYCSFKCNKEAGTQLCQNYELAKAPIIDIPDERIINKYLSNKMTSAIVLGGLEPFDSDDLVEFVHKMREKDSNCDIVIYTGYTEKELENRANYKELLSNCRPLVIKYGRFIPNQETHYDRVLGVNLVSDNQYAVRYE